MKHFPQAAQPGRVRCTYALQIGAFKPLFRTAALLVAALATASCTDTPGNMSGNMFGRNGGSGAAGFEKQYFLARSELEQGNVQNALSSYTRLAQERGPFEARILLELSHVYLRAADFEAARRTVQSLGKSQDTRLRAAALAVTGTAEQEIGRRRLAGGDKGKETKAHFRAAQTALKTTLALHPEMDQTGAMAMRLAQVRGELQGL